MSYAQITFELLKFLTPYILACVVYLFWHIQKEKEVLATESKLLINRLNDVIDNSGEVFDLIAGLYLRKDNLLKEDFEFLKNRLINFKIKIDSAIDSLDFLSEAINDKQLNESNINNSHKMLKVLQTYEIEVSSLEIQKQNLSIEELVEVHNNIVDVVNSVKSTYLEFALFRNRKFTTILGK